MPITIPTEIKKTSPTELTMTWDDGHLSVFPIKYLRAECTCAHCVNEVTGKRMLNPATIREDITIVAAEHVGSYGVKFIFSDRHENGIYTWQRLRELCPCPACGEKFYV